MKSEERGRERQQFSIRMTLNSNVNVDYSFLYLSLINLCNLSVSNFLFLSLSLSIFNNEIPKKWISFRTNLSLTANQLRCPRIMYTQVYLCRMVWPSSSCSSEYAPVRWLYGRLTSRHQQAIVRYTMLVFEVKIKPVVTYGIHLFASQLAPTTRYY